MKRFALLALSLAMVSMVFMACSGDDDPVVPSDPTTTVAITVMDMAGAWDGLDLVINGSLVDNEPMALTQDGPIWSANVTGVKSGDYTYGIYLDDGAKALEPILTGLDVVVASDMTITGDTDPTLEPTDGTGYNLVVINNDPRLVDILIKGTHNGWVNERTGMSSDGMYFYFHVHTDSVTVGNHEWGAVENDGSGDGPWLIVGPNPAYEVAEDGTVTGAVSYTIPVPPPILDVTFNVDMTGETVSGDGVHLAGSFGGDGHPDWSANEISMTDEDQDGIYSVTLTLGQETEYQFKFVNGNHFDYAEAVPSECGVDDGYGAFNRSETTGTDDTESWSYVFGACNED